MPGIELRPFTPDDYPLIASLWNTIYPDYPETETELRHEDETTAPRILWKRFIVEQDGLPIGMTTYSQWESIYHPRKFLTEIDLVPEHRTLAAMQVVYDFLREQLTEFDPITLWAHYRQDFTVSREFWDSQGYQELQRDQESRLNLTSFNVDEWMPCVAKVETQGIVLRSYPDMRRESPDVAALHQAMDDLHWDINQDIPHPEPPTRRPHEEFLKRFESPNFWPESNFYAYDGDRLAGASMLWKSLAGDHLYTGITGVRREYRKRGIATALKVKALSTAKAAGYTEVRTWNEENNMGMLGINLRLGFVRQPVWIFVGKVLKEEENEQ